MKHQTFFKAALCCLVLVMLSAPVWGQAPTPRRRGLYGDWDVNVNFGERQMPAILSFSRDD